MFPCLYHHILKNFQIFQCILCFQWVICIFVNIHWYFLFLGKFLYFRNYAPRIWCSDKNNCIIMFKIVCIFQRCIQNLAAFKVMFFCLCILSFSIFFLQPSKYSQPVSTLTWFNQIIHPKITRGSTSLLICCSTIFIVNFTFIR